MLLNKILNILLIKIQLKLTGWNDQLKCITWLLHLESGCYLVSTADRMSRINYMQYLLVWQIDFILN